MSKKLKLKDLITIAAGDGKVIGFFTSHDLMRLVLEQAAADNPAEIHPQVLPFPQGQSVVWTPEQDSDVESKFIA